MRPRKESKKEKGVYQVSFKWKILYGGGALGLSLIAAFLFYNSLWSMIFLLPGSVFFYIRWIRNKMERMKWNLNLQFRDALAGMASSLGAGYSIENSVNEALESLRCIYQEEEPIVREYVRMNERIQLNCTVEQVFFELAERTQVEDIHNFAWILYTAKRTGGDLLKITRNTSNIISERIEVSREIRTVIAAKKLESNIMSFVPAAIIAYLRLGCRGFLDSLYGSPRGILIMTILFSVYIAAYVASLKIIKIEV